MFLAFFLLGLILPTTPKAACSPYWGQGTINEVQNQGNFEHYVEIKILNQLIPATEYSDWTITIWNNDENLSVGPITLGADTSPQNLPWLAIGREAKSDSSDPINDTTLIDLSQEMDIILKDSNGLTIDYLSINGYTGHSDPSCTPAYDWQWVYDTNTSGAQTIKRIADGTGDWDADPGGSVPPTPADGNDTLPDGSTPPILTISNVTVPAGQDAVFTLTLQETTSYDISLDYQTLDNSALAGTDYTTINGILTIPAGSLAGDTFTITVPTLSSTITASQDFYLFLSNPVNVSLLTNFALGTILPAACSLAKFSFSVPSSGLACPQTRSTITITPLCADGSIVTDYSGTVDLATLPSGGIFYDALTGGNVITTLTFPGTGSNQETVYLYYANENSVLIQATDTGPDPDISSTSTAIDFRAYGFWVAGNIGDQSSCSAASIQLTAFGQQDTDPGCNIIEGFSGDKDIKAWFSYSTPSIGTFFVSMDHDGGGFSDPALLPTSEPTNNSMVTFIGGQGTFTITYPDAGAITLHLKHDTAPYDGTPYSAMLYDSPPFVIRPAQFFLRATKSDNITDINATTATGLPSHKAGESFNLTVQAACSDGTITPNYSPSNAEIWLERTGPTVGGGEGTLTLSNQATSWTTLLSAPAGWTGVSTLFNNGLIADAGLTYSEVIYNEAGLFRLHIRDPDYQGAAIAEQTLNIGRFIPDHFIVAIDDDGSLTNTCSPFTYLGEPFGYTTGDHPTLTILAKALGADDTDATDRTYNYTGNFNKIDLAEFTLTYPVSDNITAINLTSTQGSHLLVDIGDGTTTLTLGGTAPDTDTFSYDRSLGQVAPFNPDLTISLDSIIETDDVVSALNAPLTISPSGLSVEQRFGRAALQNTFGPETEDQAMPLILEYFDGTTFIANPDDSCSTFYAKWPSSPPPPTDYTCSEDPDPGGSLECDEVTVNDPDVRYGESFPLTSPGLGHRGVLEYSLAAPTWLMFDWDNDDGNNDGPYDDMPTATATFGIYRGNDRIINWREIVR